MDPWVLITGLAVIIGIAAGIVQVIDYLQKQRERKAKPPQPAVTVKPPPEPAIPSNLPPRSEFIGREKEKARVQEALASRWPLACIDGIGGIGKTALALEVAGECLQASRGEVPADDLPTFDGFIWTTAKDRELALNDVLDAVARTLDYPGIAQQPLEEKQESVWKLLQSKRYLLIVDNFETVTDEAVRDFLLRLPEPSKALITSREQKLRQAWAVSLKGLEQDEALTLIRSEGRRLGLASLEKAEEQVLLHLYQATGGAPLAIKWAVGQIKQKGQSLDTVLAALHGAKGDIFEEIFARSWSLLGEETQRILMVMPIFATSASRTAIEAASDVHHFELDEGLGRLVEMWLLEVTDELEAEKRRYSIHPLTRSFSSAALARQPEFDRTAHLRLVHYFTELAERFGGGDWDWSSFDRLEPEKDNVMALLDWCHEQGVWKEIIDIKERIWFFLHVRGYWRDSLHCGLLAIEASRKLADEEATAWHLVFGAGWTYVYLGDFDNAEEMAREALQISKRHNYQRSRALALMNLGVIARERGDLEQSRDMYIRGGEIWQHLGERKWAAVALMNVGAAALLSKEYDEAQSLFELALKENRELNNEEGIGTALSWLAHTARKRGNLQIARDLYQESLKVELGINRPLGIANNKAGLARVSAEEGDIETAMRLGREAKEILQRLGSKKDLKEIEGFLKEIGTEV